VSRRTLLLVLLIMSGCTTYPCPVCDSSEPGMQVSLAAEFCGDDPAAGNRAFRTSGREVNVLLLSGGGSRGAFGAGLLEGWRDSPEFDLVTGISTGAVMATWAYLGRDNVTDPYRQMARAYGGEMGNRDVRARRWLFPFVDSVYTLEPLRKTLREVLPTSMIAEAGRLYRASGRQLWIGTTNLETGQFCHWNLGERAARVLDAQLAGDQVLAADLTRDYHNLILASSAMPAVFKTIPVAADGSMPEAGSIPYHHADGGVSRTIYVQQIEAIARAVNESRQSDAAKKLTVYAVVNNQLVSPRQCLHPGMESMVGRSVDLLVSSLLRSNLSDIAEEVDEALAVSRKQGGWTMKVASIDYRVGLLPAETFEKTGTDRRLGLSELFQLGTTWAEADGGRGLWCEGLPEPGNTSPNCELPVSGGAECD